MDFDAEPENMEQALEVIDSLKELLESKDQRIAELSTAVEVAKAGALNVIRRI